jgi:glycosyltransferase involved in cell wall biosynthesis
VRVALVCDWFLPRMGGVELHLRDLALALRRAGVDVTVVTTTCGPAVVDGIPVERIHAPLSPVGGFAFTPGGLRALGTFIRTGRFDLVHAHASVVSPVAYAGAIAAANAGIPAVLTFHSMLHRSSLLLGASESLLGWSRSRVMLSAVSSVVAAQAARWLPDPSVGVLPNGIDAEFWRAVPPQRGAGEVVVVSAMRLSRKKRALRLVESFAEAVQFVAGAPPMRLVIAGEGPDRDAVLRRAAELGIADRVRLAGQLSRERLRELYAYSHLFVLPSERESFGIAALEARAAGLPVIAMLASGVRDFIRQGENGLLARDSRELSRFIARLALDETSRAYMSQRNSSVAAPYDWSEVAALHLQLYGAAALLRAAERASHQ